MLRTLIIFICIFISNIKTKQSTHELEDFTGKNDKELIETLAKELLIDAKLYHRHIMVIREQYNMFLSYEIGFVMGKIREKYKRMMEIYHEANTKRKNLFNILPPYVAEYKSIHYLVYMETIRSLEMEIDKLVHVLETIPEKMIRDRNAVPSVNSGMGGLQPGDEKMAHLFPPGFNQDTPPGSPGGVPGEKPPNTMLRSQDHGLKFVGSTIHSPTAEEVKQAFRDQYYSRRREDNWTLDDYYGFQG